MPKKIHGLGRGLDALLPDTVPEGGVQEIDIGLIDPNPNQPRQSFSEENLEQLAQSIRDQGVLQPILLTPSADGRYSIVAGERRWRAARMAGIRTVPCLVRELSRQQQMEAALIENMQREDLNPVEEALGIRALMDECGYTQEQAAERLAKSRPAVANLLRILTLPDAVLDEVRKGLLSAGHARVLAGLDSAHAQLALAEETLREGYSVRQLEERAAAKKSTAASKTKASAHRGDLSAELRGLEDEMRETLGLRVTIAGSERKGRIILQYHTAAELEALYEAIQRLREG
ncbi:MAG: ParB/RepB/Spo0J family partition protein [Clostridia bacterium]|nr:ParB/RepB/Spo0J family partition protein [Clostridia bacterium]